MTTKVEFFGSPTSWHCRIDAFDKIFDGFARKDGKTPNETLQIQALRAAMAKADSHESPAPEKIVLPVITPRPAMTKIERNGLTLLIELLPNPEMATIHSSANLNSHPALRVALESVNGFEAISYGSYKYRIGFSVGLAFDRAAVAMKVAEAIFRFVESDNA